MLPQVVGVDPGAAVHADGTQVKVVGVGVLPGAGVGVAGGVGLPAPPIRVMARRMTMTSPDSDWACAESGNDARATPAMKMDAKRMACVLPRLIARAKNAIFRMTSKGHRMKLSEIIRPISGTILAASLCLSACNGNAPQKTAVSEGPARNGDLTKAQVVTTADTRRTEATQDMGAAMGEIPVALRADFQKAMSCDLRKTKRKVDAAYIRDLTKRLTKDPSISSC